MYRYFSFWHEQGVAGFRFVKLDWLWKSFDVYTLENRKRYGRVYGEFARMKTLIVNDPAIAREVTVKEFHKFATRYHIHLGSTNLNKSLFFMQGGEDWKRVRSIVSPAFTSGKLKAMITPIERIVDSFVNYLDRYAQNGQVFDIKQYTSAFAMDVIASCAFGVNIDTISQPNHPMVENAKKILGLNADLSYAICVMLPSLARLLRLEFLDKQAIEYFDSLTFKIIEERLKQSSNGQSRLQPKAKTTKLYLYS